MAQYSDFSQGTDPMQALEASQPGPECQVFRPPATLSLDEIRDKSAALVRLARDERQALRGRIDYLGHVSTNDACWDCLFGLFVRWHDDEPFQLREPVQESPTAESVTSRWLACLASAGFIRIKNPESASHANAAELTDSGITMVGSYLNHRLDCLHCLASEVLPDWQTSDTRHI